MRLKRRLSYRPLKNRNYKSRQSFKIGVNFWRRINWASAGLLSAGCGSMSINLVNRLLSHSKRTLRWPKRMSRVWVNLPRRHILTRKAINTRMGKGKGSRAGVCVRLKGSALLVAYSEIRNAQLVRLCRWLRVRTSFNILSYSRINYHNLPQRNSWTRLWRLQYKYINSLITTLEDRLTEIHRPGLFFFYMDILNWRWQSPKGGFRKLVAVRASRQIRRSRRRAIRHALRRRSWHKYSSIFRTRLLKLGRELSRRFARTNVSTRTTILDSLTLFNPEDKVK